jgi:uncharacterized protein YcfJ
MRSEDTMGVVESKLENRAESTEEKVGEGVGGVGGALLGAGLGSAAGPVGTIIGGIAGAAGGWWAGENVCRSFERWVEHVAYYRTHYDSVEDRLDSYDDARVGYAVGHIAGRNPDYRSRDWTDIEPELRSNWNYDRDFDTMSPYVREGYNRSVRL